MNWKKLLQDLLDLNMTQAAIGAAIGLKQPSIAGLLKGDTQDVLWNTGNKLIDLHKRAMRKAKKSPVPRNS
jgi:hypothetical protein